MARPMTLLTVCLDTNITVAIVRMMLSPGQPLVSAAARQSCGTSAAATQAIETHHTLSRYVTLTCGMLGLFYRTLGERRCAWYSVPVS